MNYIARTVLVALIAAIVPTGGAFATATASPASVDAPVSQVAQAASSLMQGAQPITAQVAFPVDLAASDTGTMILVALLVMLWIAGRRPQR
jgi:hypothetical protein